MNGDGTCPTCLGARQADSLNDIADSLRERVGVRLRLVMATRDLRAAALSERTS